MFPQEPLEISRAGKGDGERRWRDRDGLEGLGSASLRRAGAGRGSADRDGARRASAGPAGFSAARLRLHHSFGGSFSAGSKPIFASKVAFFSIFQNLKENHLLASKFWKFLPKNWKKLQNF